jgi:hypothetical protein
MINKLYALSIAFLIGILAGELSLLLFGVWLEV